MVLTIIIFSISVLAAFLNLLSEYKRDLMMMQQSSYRIDRYRLWLKNSADTTSWIRLVGLCIFFLSLVSLTDIRWAMGFILAFTGGSWIYLITRKYKKPLVFTKRAIRIYITAIIISLIIIFLSTWFFALRDILSILFVIAESCIALFCASHIILIISVWLLKPIESNITNKYISDARDRLESMTDLIIIGITGSYGKTSTKHFLKRILDEKYSVTMTPGSFNTPMGVVRTIRENLRPYDEVFIVEMGAKQVGDIKEICDIVHPKYGILTAVGEQHLESFHSIENIRKTKFELIDSLPHNGIGIINNDFAEIKKSEPHNVKIERYAINNTDGASWIATDIIYSPSGTSFIAKGPEVTMNLQTKLVGEGNISNLLASIAMSYNLGVSERQIISAVADIEPVEHRLSMKTTVTGITILDDAFNSNPLGSSMALDVLKSMTSGRRIIVTPGMIELGERQFDLNKEFGIKIAGSADIAFVVGNYNREAICEGLTEGQMPDENIKIAPTFKEAQIMLAEILKRGDIVLYENDLPDTFK